MGLPLGGCLWLGAVWGWMLGEWAWSCSPMREFMVRELFKLDPSGLARGFSREELAGGSGRRGERRRKDLLRKIGGATR